MAVFTYTYTDYKGDEKSGEINADNLLSAKRALGFRLKYVKHRNLKVTEN